MIPEVFNQQVNQLLQQAGFSGPFTLAQMEGGANNRVYRVDVNENTFLLKVYFRHPADPRDRLGTEFAFCQFAWDHGIQTVPEPIGANSQIGVALYRFVSGTQLTPQQVEENYVQQALAFYMNLNRYRHTVSAHALPLASEAYFSLTSHLQGVERRIRRLEAIQPFEAESVAARGFIQMELSPLWAQIQTATLSQAQALGIEATASLIHDDRRLSPSDFGFHNALLTPANRLKFIDFEYAGWDDPAKLVCDFFCQPEIPVPITYFEMMAQAVVADLSTPELHLQRIALLLPVYRLKWICMLLNDFLPVDNTRRNFARHTEPIKLRQRYQLQKARFALNQIILQSMVGI